MADDTDADIDVAVTCRVLGVSRSGYYDRLGRPPSARTEANTLLLKHITEVHRQSRETYGRPRVHAEPTLGLGLEVNHKRVARLMREAGLHGLYRRRAHRGPTGPATEDDLVHRRFTGDAPDRLWLTDHHRAPHQRRETVLRRRHGRLVPPNHRLVDRPSHAHRTRPRRARHGDPPTPPRRR
ncbi:MAG: IS3 family transposase [Pseudonocardiaceae bacterium]